MAEALGELSGRARNRVHLAKLLKSCRKPASCSDEPTNDLDVETLRALEGAWLRAFRPAALGISHDLFLDRVARTSWRSKRSSRCFEQLRQLPQTAGSVSRDADTPHRIRYNRCEITFPDILCL